MVSHECTKILRKDINDHAGLALLAELKTAQGKIQDAVSFYMMAILRLGELDQTFDMIVSGGVLHHMQDPVRGWKVLCGWLKPDGLMMIGLYSKFTTDGR